MKLSNRQIKEKLTAAGVDFSGAIEKDDLVRMMTRLMERELFNKTRVTTNQASTRPNQQTVQTPNGKILPKISIFFLKIFNLRNQIKTMIFTRPKSETSRWLGNEARFSWSRLLYRSHKPTNFMGKAAHFANWC